MTAFEILVGAQTSRAAPNSECRCALVALLWRRGLGRCAARHRFYPGRAGILATGCRGGGTSSRPQNARVGRHGRCRTGL